MTQFTAQDIAMMTDWSELRESKDISLEEISQQTNIPQRKLEAIERHEFDQLGNETFALGYIRTYAKMLKEDAEVFIQVYRDAVKPNEPEPLHRTQQVVAAATRYEFWKKIKLLHLSIAVIVTWAVFMLLSGDSDNTPEQVNSTASQIASAQDEPRAAEAPPAAVETLPEPTSEPAQRDDDSISALQVENEEYRALVPAEPEAVVDEGPSVDDILIFSFSEDCWLKVTDGGGRVLVAETKRKGDNQRVFGQGPFDIMLGNARAVTLTVNGDAVSIEPVPGRNTLKFTYPAASE